MNLEIGKVIKHLRTEKGIKQDELAEYIGISFQAVSKWENGVTMPDITLLPKLAVFFGITIDDLFSVADADHFERIDYMLDNEHTVSDENFIYTKRFLDARLKENENDVEALKRYSRLYLHRINRENLAAGNLLERAINAAPFDKDISQSIYDLSLVRGTDERFVRFLEEFTSKYPTQLKAKEKLVELYIAKGYIVKAQNIISDLLQSSENLLYNLYEGDLALAQGDKEKACTLWHDAAKKQGEVDASQSNIYWHVGNRFENVCDYENAEHYYFTCFKSHGKPRVLDSIYSLAFMYNNLGRYQQAIEMWELIQQVMKDEWNTPEGEQTDWPRHEIEKLKAKL